MLEKNRTVEVYNGIKEWVKPNIPVILTLGMYDGVHRGHQIILENLVKTAREKNGKSVLLTFSPHPRKVLEPNAEIKMLSLLDEKLELLKKTGLDAVILQPFDLEFSQIDAYHFVKDILVKNIGIQELIMGYDHHLGKNREGSYENLKKFSEEMNFKLTKIEAQIFSEMTVSSSKIRKALDSGNVLLANELLGYNYFVNGKVVHGDAIGRTLNFPTANLQINPEKLLPTDGVYLCKVYRSNQKLWGLTNIGNRPTVNGLEHRIETYIFDFSEDIYDENLRVEFVEKIRSEQKFASLDALKNQIQKDCEKGKILIKQHENTHP